MSLGFSDFVNLAQLSWNIYTSCKGSSKEFKDIAGQINSLHSILKATAEHLQRHPPGIHEATELASIKSRCQDILTQVDCLLQRRRSLGTEKPRRWDKIRWALGDASQLKEKLLFQSTVLASLNASLTQFSQARVERSVDVLVQKIGSESRALGVSAAGHSRAPLAPLAPLATAMQGAPLPNTRCVPQFVGMGALCDSPTATNSEESLSENNSATPSTTVQGSLDLAGSYNAFPNHTTTNPVPGSDMGHVYNDARSTDQSIQINGNFVTSLPASQMARHYYQNATSTGKSWQFNGNLDMEQFMEFAKVR